MASAEMSLSSAQRASEGVMLVGAAWVTRELWATPMPLLPVPLVPLALLGTVLLLAEPERGIFALGGGKSFCFFLGSDPLAGDIEWSAAFLFTAGLAAADSALSFSWSFFQFDDNSGAMMSSLD
ncbi:hypothetical protein MAPG_00869 [Magnaporthiopsis poae ATCC 64411]|uniref:Uncharacterized protein n=1 Tax=Magnaporthiopsis poae (strain ATCC 64411 / 73-15) TaxID=644358 RepID=A0A0C4DM67_MAGP6|nr:hypothetical protein MAPG_00869 [Magnaporthiopsis poae ATCC 64411]